MKEYMKDRSSVLLFVVTMTFGIAPFVTPPFAGYDPSIFPVIVARPFIQPAGYAFSIWALIYLALIAHAAFGMFRRADDPAWGRVRTPMILSLSLGTAWLKIALTDPILATVGIWAMLISALFALWRADPARDRWLLVFPIAIYAGWLSAAAAVSLGVVLAGYGWLSNTASAVVMLALVLGIAVAMQIRKRGVLEYGAVVIWALAAVIAVNWADAKAVAYVAAAGILAMAVTMVFARQ
jgi:hypothetical protein